MQKSSIEWTEFTSNPIRGKCLHSCPYCYAERIRLRFKQPEELSWHPEELAQIEKRKQPSVIFMGSMYDIWGDWVPERYIDQILNTAHNCPQHTFLFLTKNPKRYLQFYFPENCWRGTTITNPDMAYFYGPKTFLSIEPLMQDMGERINPNEIDSAEVEGDTGVEGIIIGAMTGSGAIKPEKAWVERVIEAAGNKPVFLKNNLLSIFPELPRRQELAWRLSKYYPDGFGGMNGGIYVPYDQIP